jgi:hypothetical protein
MSRDDDRDRGDDRRDRDDRDDDRPRRRDRDDDEPLTREELKRKVKLPAIFLIIIGVLYLVYAGWSLVASTVLFDQQWDQVMAQQQAQQQAQVQANPQRAQAAQATQDMMNGMRSLAQVVAVAVSVVIGILAAVILFGASKMLTASSRGWGMAAAIIALIPLNCWVWLLGMGFAIWALVVLNNPQVKLAFAAGSGGRDRDDDRRD